jgi:hypothetical protein
MKSQRMMNLSWNLMIRLSYQPPSGCFLKMKSRKMMSLS